MIDRYIYLSKDFPLLETEQRGFYCYHSKKKESPWYDSLASV
nr:MAG TPA: hypothetical protein [Caudoviricetes sp.]